MLHKNLFFYKTVPSFLNFLSSTSKLVLQTLRIVISIKVLNKIIFQRLFKWRNLSNFHYHKLQALFCSLALYLMTHAVIHKNSFNQVSVKCNMEIMRSLTLLTKLRKVSTCYSSVHILQAVLFKFYLYKKDALVWVRYNMANYIWYGNFLSQNSNNWSNAVLYLHWNLFLHSQDETSFFENVCHASTIHTYLLLHYVKEWGI